LRRLFCNVLDNALKYTPVGGDVAVSGTCRKDEVEIVVTDTGVGIAPELVPRLFQRFYRVATTRTFAPGSGLGLAICEAIVQRSGGRISIDSRPGRGTNVSVTLPTTVASGR
jgi:signal transduction histidine kinase